MKPARIAWLCLALAGTPAVAAAEPITVVAAENFYGDLAQQIGGEAVKVISIMTNPDQDRHLFEASPSVARNLAAAKLVLYSGADYDPWMAKLLGATKADGRQVIVAADLVHKKAGDNPHLWYDPATMPAVAKALADTLAAVDASHAADFRQRLDKFLDSLIPMDAKIATMHAKYNGISVTATEPVFGYMADAIGLAMRNPEFQLAVENDAEPSPAQVAAFEDDLKNHKVKVLLYNTQATEELTKKMRSLARKSKVPVVGVSETAPPHMTYQAWMMSQLDALDKALAGGEQ